MTRRRTGEGAESGAFSPPPALRFPQQDRRPTRRAGHRCVTREGAVVAAPAPSHRRRGLVLRRRLHVDRYAALKPCAADMLERLVSGASLHLVVRRAPVSRRSASVLSALSHYAAVVPPPPCVCLCLVVFSWPARFTMTHFRVWAAARSTGNGRREVRHQAPRTPQRQKSANRRCRRHRRPPGACLQGRESASRRGEQMAWWVPWPCTRQLSGPRRRGRRTNSPSPRADASAMKLRCFLAACARTIAATVTADRVASTLWEFAPRSACARTGSGTFGAGTIIDVRNSSSWQPCSSSSGFTASQRNSACRGSSTSGNHSASPASPPLQLSTPVARNSARLRLLALALELGRFLIAYGRLRYLHAQTASIGTRARPSWRIQL